MKPILAITMGDPAGIGPEITVRALNRKETYEKCRPVVTGDASIMREAVKLLGYDLQINAIQNVKEAKFELGTIDVIDLQCVDMSTFEFGSSSERYSRNVVTLPSNISRKPSNWRWPTRWTVLSRLH